MRRKLLVVAMLGLAMLVAAAFWGKRYLDDMADRTAPGEFRKFYRISLDVTHDKTERLALSYILACRIAGTTQKIPENSGGYTRVPSVFGWATKGGQGIMMHSPDVCGYDLKKLVPDDFLPLMYHAEKAGDMSFFTAYMTEDAFEQKASRMTFHKAIVSEVTRADYEAWLKSSPPNIVPQVDGPWWWEVFNDDHYRPSHRLYNSDLHSDARRLGPIHCNYLKRYPIPNEAKHLVRDLRSSLGIHQSLWVLGHDGWLEDENAELSRMKNLLRLGTKDSENTTGVYDRKISGIMRRNGGGRLRHAEYSPPGEPFKGIMIPYYRTDLYPEPIPKEPIKQIEQRVETTEGRNQGFAYCVRFFSPPLDKFGNTRDFIFDPNAKLKVFWDGKLIAQLSARGSKDRLAAGYIVEGDEYFYANGSDGFEVEYARMR
jgi:hypothetical protein